MRVAVFAAMAVLGLAFGSAVRAQDDGAAPSTIVNGNDNKIVCIHTDAPTGSRMGAKKICHTNAEWRTIHANSQELVNALADRSAVGHGQ